MDLQQGWKNLNWWFVGGDSKLSELVLLERATKEAIAQVDRSAVWLQERRRRGVSRESDLETIGRRFAQLGDLEEAHKLAPMCSVYSLVERFLSNVTQTLQPGFAGLGTTCAVAEVL